MGLKKKVLSAMLCGAMVGTMIAQAVTDKAADDTLVYLSLIHI